MVRRQHCRIVYRATRSRCESRDDAVFPAVPTLCRITLVRRFHFRPTIGHRRMTVNEAFRGSNLFSRLSKVYGLLTLQDLLDRVQSKVEHSPADSSAEVRYGTYGTCASNYRDPERSERGLVMNQRETDTSEQVLKFAPKEKAPNRVAQLDDAGQAIVAQISNGG